MGLNQLGQLDQLLSGSLAAGFFFNSTKNGQLKGFCQIRKAIVEGNKLPAGKLDIGNERKGSAERNGKEVAS